MEKLKDFLFANKEQIIDLCIMTQAISPDYSHENNVESHLEYEIRIGDGFPGNLKRVEQSSCENYVKRDLVYNYDDGKKTEFMVSSEESLELKTVSCDIVSGKNQRIKYKKKNGNGGSDIIKNCADVLLIYQKYDIDIGRPALLGAIDKDKLKYLLTNRRLANDSNIDFLIRRSDFIWDHIKVSIPEVDSSLKEKITQIEKKYKNELRKVKESCYSKNLTGKHCLCDMHEIECQDANRLKKSQRLKLMEEARFMRGKGHRIIEISKKTLIRGTRIKEWLKL